MRHHQQRILTIIASLALLVLSVNILSAQNQSGKRPINKPRFQEFGYWYDSSTAMYQVQYPIITNIPPLTTAMPWDVLLAYIYTDSIAQFDKAQQAVRTIERWSTMNDTLAGMMTYMYKMTDYNPIIFTQYLNEVSLGRGGRYVTNINNLRDNVRDALLQMAPKPADHLGLYSVLYPEYILRIKVTGIDSMPAPSPINPHVFQVTADVIDTLKGMVFITCPQQSLTKIPDNAGARTLMNGGNPCIHFQYVHGSYADPNSTANRWLYPERDPAFMQANGGFQMQVGQEALIFLTHSGQRYDSTNDYFDLNVDPRASYGALPIINGQVRDVNHIWSNQTMISYDDWKARFYELRNKILTGKYY